MFHRLSIVVNLNQLTREQLRAVDKVVKVCKFPKDTPQVMYNFAVELLSRMAVCENADEQVIDLFTWCYYTLTDIHPFGNGNGRTSIIFDNCLLKAFVYPTILLRSMEQMHDENSSYNLAVRSINVDLNPLKAHFTHMLHLSREGKIVVKPDDIESQTRRIRLALATDYVADGIKRLNINTQPVRTVANNAFFSAYKGYLTWIAEFLDKSTQHSSTANAQDKKTPPLKLFDRRANTQPTPAVPTPKDYINLIKDLTNLHNANWKFSLKNNEITLFAVVDTTTAHDIKKHLAQYDDAFKIRVCKNGNSETEKLLVFERINFNLLSDLKAGIPLDITQ